LNLNFIENEHGLACIKDKYSQYLPNAFADDVSPADHSAELAVPARKAAKAITK
jgi:hypothetical protein